MVAPLYTVATNIDEAVSLVAKDPWGNILLGGGTALVLMMRQGLVAPERLIALKHIRGLDTIEVSNTAVSIGTCASLESVSRSDEIRSLLPGLAAACRSVASQRVRNVATLGGNIAEADYASDPPSALISLDASCEIVGESGKRTEPVARVIDGIFSTSLAPTEIITRITMPKPPIGATSTYVKFKSRSSEDRPCVGVAASMTPNVDGSVGALSVVVGAVASVPQWFPETTDRAVGRILDEAIAIEIADGYSSLTDPLDDMRGSSWYRRQLIRVLVKRAILGLGVST